MDVRPILCVFMWLVLAVYADSTSQDKINGFEEPLDDGLEDMIGYAGEPSKRGTMLRYGRGTIFRFGKRPSTFRYGKRGTIFRFGKRQNMDDDDQDDTYDETEKRGMLFRYGRAGDVKRGSLLRYGKRFARDLTRQTKVHKPFRFGREPQDEETMN